MYRTILEECYFIGAHSVRISSHSLGEIFSKNALNSTKLASYKIIFENKEIGVLHTDMPNQEAIDCSHRLASLLFGVTNLKKLEYVCELLNWVHQAIKIAPSIVDWIGIYFKSSWWKSEGSKDLILGPYFGEVTEHVRISIDKGICGMALREERVVNVADVRENKEHIACSLKTRSELVLPLKNQCGEFVAELDIDSNTLNAFSPELERKFRDFVATFPHFSETSR